MKNIKYYIDAFSNLHVANVRGYRAPHKAVLLLAIIDMIEDRQINSTRILLTEELEVAFGKIWNRYVGKSPVFIPDISKPFFHMQHEPFWWLEERKPSTRKVANDEPCDPFGKSKKERFAPKDKSKKELHRGSYSVSTMRQAFAYAEIDLSLYNILQNSDSRALLRVILINNYLTNQPTKSHPDINTLLLLFPFLAVVA